MILLHERKSLAGINVDLKMEMGISCFVPEMQVSDAIEIENGTLEVEFYDEEGSTNRRKLGTSTTMDSDEGM